MTRQNQKILAIDPGEKRIGLAISDETATIANPLCVLKHVSRIIDAGKIIEIAIEKGAVKIIIGKAIGANGEETPSSRNATRLAAEIQRQSTLPLNMWDESGSTSDARRTRLEMGVSRKKRSGHMDDLAAAIILQSYLDFHQDEIDQS